MAQQQLSGIASRSAFAHLTAFAASGRKSRVVEAAMVNLRRNSLSTLNIVPASASQREQVHVSAHALALPVVCVLVHYMHALAQQCTEERAYRTVPVLPVAETGRELDC